MGGMPAWLLRKYPNIDMRTSDINFMNAVTKWFNVLLPKLKPHLYANGGPIIIIQIENDYGDYRACDRNYMASLNSLVRQHLGQDVIVSTVDVGTKSALRCGSPFSVNLATISFGPYDGDPDDKFASLFNFQPDAPWVNSEYYTGWMDHWGFSHFYVSQRHFIDGLLKLISYSPRVNVNIYMFHGGTNFGFWNGAIDRPYSTQATSYDYNAPVSEAGDTTEFYQQLQRAIYKRKNLSIPEVPQNITKRVYETIQLRLVSHIVSHTSDGITLKLPLSMESLRQYEGFMLYRTQLYRNAGQSVRLKFREVADYAYVYTASSATGAICFHGTISRNDRSLVFVFTTKFNTTDLIVVVENAGYIAYATRNFNDRKGILGPVSADGKELLGWSMLPICLTLKSHWKCNRSISQDVQNYLSTDLHFSQMDHQEIMFWPVEGAVFAANLNITAPTEVADTFVKPVNFTRGILIVNDQVIGHYNQALGPQLRLYVPKSALRVGINTFVVIELDSLWLNGTMVGSPMFEGAAYPLEFDDQMYWHTQRRRPLH
ncbi:Beta-galactosidase [Fasciola hepatica]|uniref:Beta-galactosidase n=1 Tax=Fasciola hepatica TaxID=6192 RepID=A0A4E0RY73_FASHE|nr:Beta-galactosidase [Fasciola hepatica]